MTRPAAGPEQPLDATDCALIDRLQLGFPLVDAPFAAVGAELGLSGEVLLARIEALLADGTLTRFGPMFHAERLGGALTLAALAVPEADVERVAAIVNAFPEVAHHYLRTHHWNLWFVLATATPAGIAETLAAIEAATGYPVLNLPKLREFYVGLYFPASPGASAGALPAAKPAGEAGAVRDAPPDALDRALILATQAGLPLVPEPWQALAAQLASSAGEVRARLAAMLARGAIRRIAAVPNHYRLGYAANGMSVWDIPAGRIGAAGAALGGLACVSHCYQRPRLPGWPYSLFAMVHGRSRAEVETRVAGMSALLGADDHGHVILWSTRILKKTGLRLAG